MGFFVSFHPVHLVILSKWFSSRPITIERFWLTACATFVLWLPRFPGSRTITLALERVLSNILVVK